MSSEPAVEVGAGLDALMLNKGKMCMWYRWSTGACVFVHMILQYVGCCVDNVSVLIIPNLMKRSSFPRVHLAFSSLHQEDVK